MFKLDECVAYIASNAVKKLSDTFNDRLTAEGATRIQWIALYYITQNKNLNQAGLAELMNTQRPTVARLVDRLERDGLVARISDPADRRGVLLRCTPKGAELYEKMLPVGECFSADIAGKIPRKDMEVFIRVLEQLVNNCESAERSRTSGNI